MTTFDKQHYENLSAHVLELAKQKGATSAEVSITLEAGFSVSSRLGQVETVEHHQDKGLALTVFFGQQMGSTSSTDLSPQALEASVEKACNIAKYTSPDPSAGLADKEQMAFNYPTLAIDFPWDISTEEALTLAIECENHARKDPRITNSEGASLNSHRSLHVFANTHDFVGSFLATQHSINCVLIAQENGQMHRDYDYTVARDPQDLLSVETLATQAANRTVRRLGARRLKTRSAPVIFSAEIAKSLLGHFIAAISGGNIYRDSSFLVNHLEKSVLPAHISLIQHPLLPKAMGSAAFDNEGVRTRELAFVDQGTLKSYLLSSYSARKLGMISTGNAGGVFNLAINNSAHSLQDLIKQMDTGLLVTEMMGQGVNIVNGDYSRGAFGFWIENGEVQYPVQEVTIAGNLRDIFLDIVAVSNDVDKRGRIHTGSILINKMMIAGE